MLFFKILQQVVAIVTRGAAGGASGVAVLGRTEEWETNWARWKRRCFKRKEKKIQEIIVTFF
jgi:hypothetical protein